MNGAILQQVFVVEFVIQGQMCDDCHRVEAKDFWNSVVQVRQKVPLMIRIILFMLLTTSIILNMLCW
jgi:NMD protein affecting ribosome stability and mRNA decay